MPSTLVHSSSSAAHVVIDELPPVADAMREVVACRANDIPVPPELVNSVRAYRLGALADAVERYNARVMEELLATA